MEKLNPLKWKLQNSLNVNIQIYSLLVVKYFANLFSTGLTGNYFVNL